MCLIEENDEGSGVGKRRLAWGEAETSSTLYQGPYITGKNDMFQWFNGFGHAGEEHRRGTNTEGQIMQRGH